MTAYVIYRTRFGLRLRAGENPEAAMAAGVSVTRMRYAGVLISGALAALGGACHRPEFALHAQHDRRAWVHSAGRADLRQMGSGRHAPRLPFRLRREQSRFACRAL